MRCVMLFCVLSLAVAVTVAEDFEESFTIFIDLDDFHVVQEGNHEFLHKDTVGDGDNVVLHMSEEQVRYHQSMHDTHNCEPPSEVHEVVSFLQEKMYEAPSAQFPPTYGGMGWVPPIAGAPPMANIAAPAAPAAASAPAVPANPQPVNDEEDAVSRFRDAYKAYKLLNHALEGLSDYVEPAGDLNEKPTTGSSSSKGLAAAPTHTASLWDAVLDDDDRKILALFSGKSQSIAPRSPASIGDIVSETYKNVAAESAKSHKKHSAHSEHRSDPSWRHDLTLEDREALKSLLEKLGESKEGGKLKGALEDALDESSVKPTTEIKSDKPQVEKPETPTTPSGVKTPVSGASRPSAPLMTSHIEKAPKDFIPESVYAQQQVPFKEMMQEPKHVARRVLIPRMEEPGPVIGGDSRPMHIRIPSDDKVMPATRPVAPMHISVASEITTETKAQTQAQTQNPATQAESVKPSSLAAVNDEALTAPEVVIF